MSNGRSPLGDVVTALLQAMQGRIRHDPQDPQVRVAVAARASGRCEYCLLPTGGQFQIDHIIPPDRWSKYVGGRIAAVAPQLGRGGPDHLDNFAWACPFCNNKKRQRLFHPPRGRGVTRLFDPRYDAWENHFFFTDGYLFILGVTPIGEATVAALGLNESRPAGLLGQRHAAILSGDYPPTWARELNVVI